MCEGKTATDGLLWCSGGDLLWMFHSVDQQYTATKPAMTFQWLLHRYCNACVINLVYIDLHTQPTIHTYSLSKGQDKLMNRDV